MLAREQKKSVIDQYQTHATDTGSPEVQIAIISERIGQLTDHFKAHQKDHGSRRGLLMLVSKRRRLLDYLKRYDSERYKTVIGKLGIRKLGGGGFEAVDGRNCTAQLLHESLITAAENLGDQREHSVNLLK